MFLSLVLFSADLSAVERTAPDRTSLRIGIVSGGVLEVDGVDWDTEFGLSLGASFDPRVSGGWSVGMSLDVHRLNVSPPGSKSYTMPMLNVSLPVRYLMPLGSRGWYVRPGVAPGLSSMREIEELEGSQYATLFPSIELLGPFSPETYLILEIGLLQAWGGDGSVDTTLKPHWLFRMGILL